MKKNDLRITLLAGSLFFLAALLLFQHYRKTSDAEQEQKRGAEIEEANPTVPRIGNHQGGKTAAKPTTKAANEVRIGSWSTYPKEIPKDVLKIRLGGGALNASHSVTPAIVRRFNLTSQEEEEVNELLIQLFAQAELETANRIHPVPGKAGVFRIPADEALAEQMLSTLTQGLDKSIGSARSRDLLNSIDLLQYHAAFGATDAEISFEDENIGTLSDPTYTLKGRYVLTDPTTGEFVAGGGGFFENLTDMFGTGAFAIEGNCTPTIPAR